MENIFEQLGDITNPNPDKKVEEVKPLLDVNGRDFYDLMQNYRIAPMANQDRVCLHFNNVKAFVKDYAQQQSKVLAEALKDLMEEISTNWDADDEESTSFKLVQKAKAALKSIS